LPADLSARLIAQALCVTSGNGYRPRMDALRRAMGQARASLHGCILARRARSLRVMREYAAVAGLSVLQGQFWDRWTIEGPPLDGATIRALGPDGARQVHRPRSLPHAALLSSPALWQDQHLIAAPLAGHGSEYRARLRRFLPNLSDAATQ
jgi:tRNA(Ile)-lysidine synthase